MILVGPVRAGVNGRGGIPYNCIRRQIAKSPAKGKIRFPENGEIPYLNNLYESINYVLSVGLDT